MRTVEQLSIPPSLESLAELIHEMNVEKGFWPPDRNFGEALALTHSELSEALEEHRSGHPDVYFIHTEDCNISQNLGDEEIVRVATQVRWKHEGGTTCTCIPKPEGKAVEIVDAIIRELDMLFGFRTNTTYSIDDILIMKLQYNDSRPHKHGRKY